MKRLSFRKNVFQKKKKHVVQKCFIASLLLLPLMVVVYFCNFGDDKVDGISSVQVQVDELRERLNHASMMNQQRNKDLVDLHGAIKNVLHPKVAISGTEQNGSVYVGRGTLWQKQLNGHHGPTGTRNSGHSDLQLPSLRHYLPHLSRFDSLQPVFKIATSRIGATMVLGVPTIRRPVDSYLISTLESLISNMSEHEKEDSLIIVCIAENDMDYVEKEIDNIKSKFGDYLDSGLLEVISPPESYYPDFSAIRNTLGDSPNRVRWRTKQNLDYAYLMMYAQSKGTFYVQLEDDILTKPRYISTMKSFAYKQLREKKDWIILDFCQLGFIGKMFKSVDLSKMVTFLAMFHSDKPVDWLLDHMIQTKVCRFDRDSHHCKKEKDGVWIHYRPSLFQHIGMHSSLKGKLQKLKDKQFGKLSSQRTHVNPPATLRTSMRAYRSHTLQRAYRGEDYFWSRKARKGDIIEFHFSPPLLIERYYFRSGNDVHYEALLIDASVQILVAGPSAFPDLVPYTTTPDGHFIVGSFKDTSGVSEGEIVPTVGPVCAVRIKIESDNHEGPVVLSEIVIEAASATSPIATVFNITVSNSSLNGAT